MTRPPESSRKLCEAARSRPKDAAVNNERDRFPIAGQDVRRCRLRKCFQLRLSRTDVVDFAVGSRKKVGKTTDKRKV
jgi:hypothetical protein